MKRMLTSCFGLGFMPIASGTWGSMPVAIGFGLMCYFGVSALTISLIMIVVTLAASLVTVHFSPAVIEASGKKDPSEVVSDEVAGQAVTFIGASVFAGTEQLLLVTLVGFLVFRFFDIVKIFPCRRLEKLEAGWGILLDDIVAGIYAAVVLWFCVRLWIGGVGG